jgi:excisionase family DNA binding protein
MTPRPTPSEGSLERPPHKLEPHPHAERVPAMPAEEYAAFRADVERRGVLVPLEITEGGTVLDGRQRLRAAAELELESVPVQIVAPADELDHMLRLAVLRRQLSPSQRAALVLELDEYRQLRDEAQARQRANLKQSPEVASSPPRGKTRELAAAWAGIGARTLQDAAMVQEHDKESFERVKAGEVGAALAARRVRRALRDRALPAPPPLPKAPFEVIYADPPWQLGNPDGPQAPENHYPTMATEEICGLPVPAAEEAVLFLWAVSCLLLEALEVIEAWGFACKTTLCWVKPSIGPGVWLRNRHELLLVGPQRRLPASGARGPLRLGARGTARKAFAEADIRLRANRADVPAREQTGAVRPHHPPGLGGLGQGGAAMNERLLTAGEVAELLAVPESWVREATREARLPYLALGRYRRYSRSAIGAWLEEQQAGRPSVRTRPLLDLQSEPHSSLECADER